MKVIAEIVFKLTGDMALEMGEMPYAKVRQILEKHIEDARQELWVEARREARPLRDSDSCAESTFCCPNCGHDTKIQKRFGIA